MALQDGPGVALPGTWYLERWEIAYDDGRPPTLPFGEGATGMLVYTEDGSMAACIARAGRARFAAESPRAAPEAARAAAFDSFFAYAGAWSLREAEGRAQVVHEVREALNPGFVGTEQVRDMALEGDRLTLSASDTLPGSTALRHHRLIWRR